VEKWRKVERKIDGIEGVNFSRPKNHHLHSSDVQVKVKWRKEWKVEKVDGRVEV
jgi:hypothetical protein